MKNIFNDELIAAPFTPMTEEGLFNSDQVSIYADHLLSKGIYSVFICGTTGESTSLTINERKAIAASWIEAAQGRIKVMVHVGGCSLREGNELAKHASSMGAAAVSAFAPNFIKAANAKDLAYYFKELLEGVDDIPFYYYNMPSMTNVNISVIDLLKEVDGLIPNFQGVKFTHNDLMDMLDCAEYANHKYEILNGFDEILLAGLHMGANGAVGSTYNYIPEVYQSMKKALAEHDLKSAQYFQMQSIQLIRLLNKYGGIRTGKCLMKYVGIDCGPVRSPLTNFTSEEIKEIHNQFDLIFKQ